MAVRVAVRMLWVAGVAGVAGMVVAAMVWVGLGAAMVRARLVATATPPGEAEEEARIWAEEMARLAGATWTMVVATPLSRTPGRRSCAQSSTAMATCRADRQMAVH